MGYWPFEIAIGGKNARRKEKEITTDDTRVYDTHSTRLMSCYHGEIGLHLGSTFVVDPTVYSLFAGRFHSCWYCCAAVYFLTQEKSRFA